MSNVGCFAIQNNYWFRIYNLISLYIRNKTYSLNLQKVWATLIKPLNYG